jgi:hypothetical protein
MKPRKPMITVIAKQEIKIRTEKAGQKWPAFLFQIFDQP